MLQNTGRTNRCGGDQEFTLEQHGDRYERLWWHFLKNDFSEWGTFWAHHVVPLTNRIDDNFKKNDQAKLLIRNDPSINKGVEAVVMANYSVFYYLARSRAIVASEPHLFPEDGFIFLRATTENIARFLNAFTRQLAPKLNISKDKIPEWKDIKETETAKEILEYRTRLFTLADWAETRTFLGNLFQPHHISHKRNFLLGMC